MSVKIFIAGDVVPNERTVSLFDSRQLETLFHDFLPVIKGADISIVNYESPIINGKETPIEKSGPCLHSSKKTLMTLQDAGFNVITLANNHFRDQGQNGVETTIDTADELGVKHVGGGKTWTEAMQILYLEANGLTAAVINVCEHEFSIAGKDYGGSNPLDIINVVNDIHEAKRKADFLLLIIHGGVEMYQLPTPRMKRLYRFFVEQGANAVVNHHQHCYSGYEIYQGCPIFYGLGNFCFDWDGKRKSNWNKGYAVTLLINKNKEVKCQFELHPYIQCDDSPAVTAETGNGFEDDIALLNKVIADDNKLQKYFVSLVDNKKMSFLRTLYPYNNRIINKLMSLGILKPFSFKKRLQILNTYTCESHWEIMQNALRHK